jgi:hypothetical protein
MGANFFTPDQPTREEMVGFDKHLGVRPSGEYVPGLAQHSPFGFMI